MSATFTPWPVKPCSHMARAPIWSTTWYMEPSGWLAPVRVEDVCSWLAAETRVVETALSASSTVAKVRTPRRPIRCCLSLRPFMALSLALGST